jgi:hypothetical protein
VRERVIVRVVEIGEAGADVLAVVEAEDADAAAVGAAVAVVDATEVMAVAAAGDTRIHHNDC